MRRDKAKTETKRLAIPPHLQAQMVQLARDFRKTPTASENQLWQAVRNGRLANARFRRQQPIGPFIVDFYCPSHGLIVEVDGPVHDGQAEHDRERQALLEACGYGVLRVRASDVEHNLQRVLQTIYDALTTESPSPLEGEGLGVRGSGR
jgi:very-short-patch-repair endonuclease